MKSKFSSNSKYKKQKPAQKNNQGDQFFEPQVQRKCENCKDEEKEGVQKKAEFGKNSQANPTFSSFMNQIDAKGSGLPTAKKQFFEGRMQDDFSGVRLHTDAEATQAAKEIGAKAFAYQNHIVFNKAYYQEGSLETQKILAHELKHVQQQKSGRHQLQMMAEDESTSAAKEESQEGGQAQAMENEALAEEVQMMVPEAVPDFQTFGKAVKRTVYGNSVSFEGQTDATFNGGVGSTRNLRRTPAEGCAGCEASDCFHYTGQLHIQYSVATSVSLPDVPEGLSPCQHERVRDAIDNVLAPHEQDHVTAFSQYNGSVVLPIDYTGCSAGIQEHVQQLHEANASARQAAAQQASDALDPFHISVDMDCEDAAPDQNADSETD